MVFASCADVGGGAKTDDNVIVVKLPSKTRAVEDQANVGAYDLANVTVFLLNGNTVLEVHEFEAAEIAAEAKRIEQVNSAVNNVIVVANVPADKLAEVKALTAGTAIKSYGYSVASQNSGIEKVTRMGEGTPQTIADPNPDDHNYKEVLVRLDPVTARFEIGDVKPGKGIKSVELVGVWVNAFYPDGSKASVTTYPSTDVCWVTDPDSELSPSTTPYTDVDVATYHVPSYHNLASDEVYLDDDSKVYAYQVFAGSNIPHVIMLIKGEYDEGYYDAGKKYYLGYVTFTRYTEGSTDITSIEANTIYKMGVGKTGVEVTPEIITPKPELEDFDLGIKVEIVDWIPKTVTPGV